MVGQDLPFAVAGNLVGGGDALQDEAALEGRSLSRTRSWSGRMSLTCMGRRSRTAFSSSERVVMLSSLRMSGRVWG